MYILKTGPATEGTDTQIAEDPASRIESEDPEADSRLEDNINKSIKIEGCLQECRQPNF